jgi:endonuclease-8
MPEGDTVWLQARRLDRALAGRAITYTDLRHPRLATAQLSGRAVAEVAARGKHLLMRMQGGLTLHSHLGMDGAWHTVRQGGRRPAEPAWQLRAAIANDEWIAFGYRLRRLDLIATREEDRVVGHLGPDLLAAGFDAADARRRLTARPDREIGEALLDQATVAGLGNLYVAELLFLTGTNPWTPVRAVRDPDRLLALARELLAAGIDTAGDHPVQVTTGNPRPGSGCYVYRRAGEPCRRCGTLVRSAWQGAPPRARQRYWCPACQPLPQT